MEPPCEHIASDQPLIVDAVLALTALGDVCQFRGFANLVTPGPAPFDEGAAGLAELDANACHADIVFDDDAARACRQVYLDAAQDCSLPIDTSVCRRLLVGNAGLGDACGSASVCDEDGPTIFCTVRAGGGCGTCFDARPRIGDVCHPLLASCELGSRCSQVEGVDRCVALVPRRPTGASCTTSSQCAANHLCREASCRRQVADGGACGPETICIGESVCNGGACVPPVPVSQACTGAIPCVRGARCTAGTCEIIRSGDVCVGDSDCLPFLNCNGAQCFTAPSSGACRRGACAAGFTCSPALGCIRDISVGDSCDSDNLCGADATCTSTVNDDRICIDNRAGAHQFGLCPEGALAGDDFLCTFDAATPAGNAIGDVCVPTGNACGPTLETGLGCDDSGHCVAATVVADGETCDADNRFTGVRWCRAPSKCWVLPGNPGPTCIPVRDEGDACDAAVGATCPHPLRCELTGPGPIRGGDFHCVGTPAVGAGEPCPGGGCLIGLVCFEGVCTGPEDLPRPNAEACSIE